MPYRVCGSTLTALGRSQSLARRPGTHSRILSGIQRAAQTVLGVYLKRTCSRVTSASSALAVLNDYALYKSTHSLSHSLTHSRSTQTGRQSWTADSPPTRCFPLVSRQCCRTSRARTARPPRLRTRLYTDNEAIVDSRLRPPARCCLVSRRVF